MANQTLTRGSQPRQKKSPWFWAFWTLLGIIIITLLGSGFVATQAVKVTDSQSKIASTDATFDVTLNKKQVNALVAYYLNDSRTSNYQFRVEDNIMMYGNSKFLGQTFKIGMILSPEVTKNGNIILTAKKMAIGNLPLPISTVMSYVKTNYHAPKFVTINPSKQQIFVDMTKLPVVKGMSFRAKIIDLKTDQFVFQGGLVHDQK